ncbi:TlpA disulfide reductase family protein [Ferruginibacter sp.]|uniref:TlpA family protein disulfide reductase n=1 Tax=Ferruginibacter sp. TaxID=1940288 RepID=UPI0026593317|nr:TlpA disulfide reductase family protein [Ferruginibacter sp.]
MKKLILFASFIGCSIIALSQTDSSAKALPKFETIPSFAIYSLPDSTVFSNKDLHKNKPFIIMFFSPDCEHCQKEMKELLAYKEELKNIRILMASPGSYPMIKQFYQDYGVASMPNIKMGHDDNFALGSIFQLRTFPSIFVYDQQGKLSKAFVGNISVPAILDAAK